MRPLKLTHLLLLVFGLPACVPAQTTHVTLVPGDTLIVTAPPPATTTTPPPDTTPPPVTTGTHEPAGMTTEINTGHITAATITTAASGSYQTLTTKGPLTTVWTNFSPVTANSLGEARGNLAIGAAGGLQITYPTTLAGGNSPVRFGATIPSGGHGTFYLRETIVATNYAAPSTANGIKIWEPRTNYQGGTSGENHVIGTRGSSTDIHSAYPYVLLQGPGAQSRNLSPTVASPVNIFDGQRHVMEILLTPETPAGAGNGTETEWVDGVRQAMYSNAQYLAAGQTAGWPYLMCDPTYGGAPATVHPPQAFTVTHDSIFVSVK